MDLVGKIFVGIIATMCVVVFALALMITADHKDWRKVAGGHQQTVDALEKDKGDLTAIMQSLKDQQSKAAEQYKKTLLELTTQEKGVSDTNKTLKTAYDDKEKKIQNVSDSISVNSIHIQGYWDLVAILTKELEDSQKFRAAYLRDLAKNINLKYNYASIITMLENKNVSTLGTLDNMKAVLAKNNLEADPSLYPPAPPYIVKGLIETLQKDSGHLLTITIGSADGLRPGHLLEVYRGSSYLGRVRVLTTEPNRAVCEVLSAYRRGTFRTGDSVTSKLTN